jgi:general secretion pathway protein D
VHPSLSNHGLAAAFLAALTPWAPTTTSHAGEGGFSTVDIAEREVIRRQQRVSQATEEEAAGDKAMADRDYEAAVGHYRAALDLIPDSDLFREQRQRVIAKYANASVKLARQRADGGEYDAARTLLNNVLAIDPENTAAQRLLDQLEDPEWFNPANSKEHMGNVQEVKRNLDLGLGYFDLGQFDKARESFNRVLAIDPYNTAARRQLERTERRISDYLLSARDHTRAKMLREVDEQWETAVPSLTGEGGLGEIDRGGGIDSSQVILDKMRTLIIPSVALDQATVEEAVEFLRLKSKELDVATTDPTKKGVNFILRLPATGAMPRISSLNLSNVPLEAAVKAVADQAGLRSRVEQFAVIIAPADSDQELATKVFRVPPDFLTLGGSAGGDAEGGGGADPFAAGGGTEGGGSAIRPRASAIDILKQAGIQFPESGTAFFSSATSTLTVRNTPANLDLVDQFVESISNKISKMINITAKFIEVNQKNTDEFGFDWLIGAFDVSNGVFAGGGTAGNRAAGPVGGTNWSFVPPGQGTTATPVGGSNLTTGGLRFGDNAISNNAIDGLLSATTSAEGTAESSVTPAVFGVAGVFTDPQFQVVLRALNQKKGTDLLTAPQVTTRSGQRAKVEVIREFIYPTEFEPPEIPQDFGGGGSLFGGGGVGQTGGGFPVTPTTPTAFETRNTGVTLEVEPTLGADGYTIDLTLAPEVVEFEGFVNYGSPIQTSAVDALGNPTTIILTENRIEQPVFSSRKLSTSVTIWDGMTLGVGGLISDYVQSVEDKVPIFGDIPYVGRLFRTKADQFFKKNLMMFVTVNLIDPSGQKVNAGRTGASDLGGTPTIPAGPDDALIPQSPEINFK